MGKVYKMRQLLDFRKKHCYRCFINALNGNLSSAEFELDILNTIQEEFLERDKFSSIGDFLLRFNPVSKRISDEAKFSELEEALLNDIDFYIKENRSLDFPSFNSMLRQYWDSIDPLKAEGKQIYRRHMLVNRIMIIYDDLMHKCINDIEHKRLRNVFSEISNCFQV